MESRIAKVVPLQELREYFGSKNWKLEPGDKSGKPGFSSHEEAFDINVKIYQTEVIFKVNIEAIDHPEESKEIVTKEPVEEIIRFLSVGIPGAEEVFKQGFSPNQVARALYLIASAIQNKSLRKKANIAKLLRRIITLPHLNTFHRVTTFLRTAITEKEKWDAEFSELYNLKTELKRHGWTITEHKSEIGKPQLEINIQDLYEIIISVDDMVYDYQFELGEHPESIDEGKSDDPIAEFREWYNSAKFQGTDVRMTQFKEDDVGQATTIPVPRPSSEPPEA